ncbi:hypothetical protein Tco_1077451 [Tanacetum coccineum]
MAFRNFMYAKTNEDLSFLPKEPSLKFGTGLPSASINMEPPIALAEPAGQMLLKVMKQMKGKCEVLKEREKSRDQEYEELRIKCEVAMTEFERNLTMVALCEKIITLQGEKVASLEAEKVKLESVEASLRQELENAKLDRAEVVSKVYRMWLRSWCRAMIWEHTKAGNDLVTATFQYLVDVVADPHASIEVLLPKKHRVLQRPVPIRTHMHASSAPS